MGLTAACVQSNNNSNSNNSNNNKSIKQLLLLLLLLAVRSVLWSHSIVSALSRSSTIEHKNEFE